jgi:glucose/arabinose dehydrogenase
MRKFVLAVLLAGFLPTSARATVLDPNFVESDWVIANELYASTALAWAPDGSNRLFVARQNGQILIIKNGQLLATPFATVAPILYVGECGLLGITFDQDFLTNHFVYVFATVSTSEQQIIRYTASGDTGLEKKTIVAGLPTRGVNHDGGALGVGPDGQLYWAIGDNGGGLGTGPDLTSLGSKVGRANTDGSPPADNPFHDGSGGPRDFIWARGMRNPFTLAFQPTTGLLWLDVVGDSYEQIFIVRKGDHGGYSGQEVNQQPPNIRPVIKYRTNGVQVLPIQPTAMAGAVRSNGVATFFINTEHYLRVGEKVTVSGVADPSFDGTFYVTSVPSDYRFTVTQAGPDATSGSVGATVATATTAAFGGCVTGGDFYDSSLVPASHRGNFFFGDYNNIGSEPGRIMRATIDPATNTITSVDLWAKDLSNQVDIALGPDGALYLATNTARKVSRVEYKPSSQGLVVTPLNLWMAERGSAVVNVRLAMAPAADVVVTVGRSGGDSDIGVSAGSTLTFTPANWSVPQIATVAAATDADGTDDLATVSVSAAGLTAETVTVHARDVAATPGEDGGAPMVDAGAPDASDAALDAAADATADSPGVDAGSDFGGPITAPDAALDAAVATGGSDAGGTADAGTGGAGGTADAGGIPAKSSSGCGCHLGGHGQTGGAALAVVFAGLLLRRRRRG